jgi:hypothetical protein
LPIAEVGYAREGWSHVTRNIRRWLMGAMGLGSLAIGCVSAPQANPSAIQNSSTASGTVGRNVSSETIEQEDAQKAWCEYLDALHRRAAASAVAMPSLEKCLHARTYAAPKMLRQTAQCSRKALDQFEGDPFTREYAAEIAHCGSTALDSCEARAAEVKPFLATICSTVARCGESSRSSCMEMLDGNMSVHLSRAVGALNDRGRFAFQACLTQLDCGEIGSQVVQCLEPIMEGLLWLPE